MRRLIQLSGYSLFYFAVLFLAASCNEGTETKKSSENNNKDMSTTTIEKEEKKTTTSISGTLDTLYIDAATFKNLPKSSLVFSFSFLTDGTQTLIGWSCKNPKGKCTGFDTNPNVKLMKYGNTGKAYGPEINFGNVVLTKKEVKDIIAKLGSKYNYLVFIPEIKNGFINYSVQMTNDKTAIVAGFEDTMIDANPSPPKGYND